MVTPQHLEQQFSFRYPQLYHQLYADGMLDWGMVGPDWISRQFPVLRHNPPLLLFANDFELMSFANVKSQLEEFADPTYWMHIQPGLCFVPFATNGAGDWYCFFPNRLQDEDIPVVFLRHDANRATYKAGNLQDFIFRSMLEAVADIDEAEYGLLSEKDFGTDLQNFLRTHRPYLSEQQQQTITGIYNSTAPEKPLTTEEELQALLKKEISWEQLDKDFKYTPIP